MDLCERVVEIEGTKPGRESDRGKGGKLWDGASEGKEKRGLWRH